MYRLARSPRQPVDQQSHQDSPGANLIRRHRKHGSQMMSPPRGECPLG